MNITSRYCNGTLTVFADGELDHHSAKGTLDEITSQVYSFLPKTLVLNFERLSFMDSSGIALVLKANRLMRESGGQTLIENPQAQALKVLTAARIERMVEIKSVREVTT